MLSALKERAAIVDIVKGAPYRSSDTSADNGDVIHDWIDRHIKGDSPSAAEIKAESYIIGDKTHRITPGARAGWNHFLNFETTYKIKWLLSETTVWSEKHDYAGTLDWIAKIGNGIVLGDTKTGNGVYPEVGMQVAAIYYADYALGPSGEQFQLPRADKFAAMHVRPRGVKLHPLSEIEECYKAFLGLRACFEWDKKISDKVIGYAPKITAPAQRREAVNSVV